jgi:hypothetical protein
MLNSHSRRLLAATTASAAVVLASPIMGQTRGRLRSVFPQRFGIVVGGLVAGAVTLAVVTAFARIQRHRRARYSAILAALAIGISYSLMSRSGFPEVDAVERVHFVEYGAITLLFHRAWRNNGDLSAFVLPVLAGLLVGTLDEFVQ